MVLTNFELWAADGSSALNRPLELETSAHNRHLNPFDPRAVPAQLNSNVTQHLSSNGYYGFSYVNAAHNDIEDSINNNNNNNINSNNNNNTSTYNFMANDVNGMSMTTTTPQTHAVSANNSDSDCAVNAAGHAANVTRCKKRFFVMNDADDCTASNNKNHNGSDIFAKRCRFDDDFAAQYCNDFFSMPSTQIATQSCLMDTEEVIQTQPQQQQYFPPIQQQQQVDEAMFDNNNNNTEKYELNSHLQLQHEQQQQQSQMQTATTNAQLTPPPPTTQHQQLAAQSSPQQQHLYHQQQHYQDKCHLHNSCDTLSCNCHRTCKIDTQNSENLIKSHNLKKINENVANDFKVDDATLFAQLHGGCWHHFVNNNNTITN